MILNLILMLASGAIGGCLGALAVLIWADGLIDKTTAEDDVADWEDEALDAEPIDGREWGDPL